MLEYLITAGGDLSDLAAAFVRSAPWLLAATALALLWGLTRRGGSVMARLLVLAVVGAAGWLYYHR